MPMLTNAVDAVVGIDRHRDTYEVLLATPTGTPIATVSLSKDSAGYNDLLAWLVRHAPGPRLALSGEGTGRYAAGLARAIAAAGMILIESAPPGHVPRGEGPSTPIDADACAPAAWQLDAARLLSQQAEGDREALRILLGARQDLTTTATRQGTRLRALLLSGDNTDRKIARAAFTEAALIGLARRPQPHDACRQRCVRHAEIRRLALILIAVARDLKANSTQLQAIVNDLVPGLTEQRGIGPISAAQSIVNLSYSLQVPKQRQPPVTEATSSWQQHRPDLSASR